MGWIPTEDLTFTEVGSTKVGRMKMWLHYDVFHPWVFPFLPSTVRTGFYKVSRRWLYGPNANNEDLIELIERATRRDKDLRDKQTATPIPGG